MAPQKSEFEVGDRVCHPTRGDGTVMEGKDGDERLYILFDDGETHRYKQSSLHKITLLNPKPGALIELRVDVISSSPQAHV